MTVNEFLEIIEKDIEAQNPDAIKTRIGNLAIVCRDFEGQHAELYKDIIHAVKKAHPELFEQFNGSPPLASKEKTEFTERDFIDAVFEIKQNLCMERIKDVMTIGNAVYGKTKNNSSSTKNKDNNTDSDNHSVSDNVPSKSYKRGESVNTNQLQSLINRCKKAIDVIEYDADNGKRSDVKGDLHIINSILNESRYLMNQLIKINDKPKTNNEAIAFELLEKADYMINETINECFSDIDKLVGVINNCEHAVFNTSILNEESNGKSKIDTALKVANHAWKAIVRKLKVIVSQLVALFKRISGNNKIPKDGNYIDISKAINIVDKIISGSK